MKIGILSNDKILLTIKIEHNEHKVNLNFDNTSKLYYY